MTKLSTIYLLERGKSGLIRLVKEPGNVSRDCKVMVHFRASIYRLKELYETGGKVAHQKISRFYQITTPSMQ